MMENTCNKCGTLLQKHKSNKRYFFCSKCKQWLKCWIPSTPKEMSKLIDKYKSESSLGSYD